MTKDFKVSVPRKLVADLLEHFGPDPVTRAWCAEALDNKGRWLFCEIKDESKEAKGSNILRHVLTDAKIAAGLGAWITAGYDRAGDLFNEDRHDAPLADLFVQTCLFGEEKYA